MKQNMKHIAALLAGAALLSACASGTRVDAEGKSDELVWPKPASTTFNKDRGTFPNLNSLREVRDGMTKDQLYYLLGRPHFDEGFRVREWDYLFHFNTPGQGTSDVTTCQFKVLFDKERFARSFAWRAVDPVDGVCPPAAPAVPTPAPIEPAKPATPAKSKRYTLSADALFVFDRSDLSNMHEKGRKELDNLAYELTNNFDELRSVRVVGHTDLLGSDMYNQALSQRRAETVRRYLVERGVPANVMFAYGAGETQPVKECVHKGNRTEYIACLQPNRRVEVEVDGSAPVR